MAVVDVATGGAELERVREEVVVVAVALVGAADGDDVGDGSCDDESEKDCVESKDDGGNEDEKYDESVVKAGEEVDANDESVGVAVERDQVDCVDKNEDISIVDMVEV